MTAPLDRSDLYASAVVQRHKASGEIWRRIAPPSSDCGGLLKDLPSLARMTRRDQRVLEARLRDLTLDTAIPAFVRLYLLRACYELEKV